MSSVLSVVVPSRNEQKHIKECLEALEENVMASHIIVVDTSDDLTSRIIKVMTRKYVNLSLVETDKHGKGAALKEGFKYADGIIVMTDADNSYPAGEIPKMVELLEEADIVIGSRYCRGGRLENVSFLGKLTGWSYSLLFRTFFGVKDPQSGLKAFRKEILDTVGPIKKEGFEWDSVFVARAKRKGLKIVEHPIHFKNREKASNVRVLKLSWSMGINLVRLVLNLE